MTEEQIMSKKFIFLIVLAMVAMTCLLCACHEHQFGEWTVTQDPTCTQEGTKQRVCECGEKETQPVAPTGHSHTAEVTPPNCIQVGYTTYTCECGDSYIANTVDPTGHQAVLDAEIPATCTEDGLSEGSHCSTCGQVLVAQTTIPALGHDETVHQAQNPTCEEEGWKEYVSCSRCDYTTYESVPATGHTFGDWTISKAPTCEEEGSEERICHCGEKETQPVNPTGHTFGDWTTQEATCTEDGYTERSCSCGKTEKIIIPNYGGHSCEITTIQPTCTEKGYAIYTCWCGYSETVDIDALGHDTVTNPAKNPTCEEEGWKEYVSCSRCDYSTFETIPALGHDYIDDICTICGDCSYSVGLQYTPSADQTYYIVSLGTCTETDIVIPETHDNLPVKEIAEVAFASSNITSIIIPSSINYIGYEAFSGCKQLTKVIITDIASWCNMTVADGTYPHKNAKHLYLNDQEITHLVIPEGVTTLHSQVFAYCQGLVSVSIPSTVTSIGLDAGAVGIYTFQFCPNLAEIHVDENNPNYKSVDGVLYSKDGKTLIQYPMGKSGSTFTLPSDVTKIYSYAFYSCNNLQTVIIPQDSQLTLINSQAFWKCTSLTNITLENCTSLTTIGKSAFEDCTSLTSVTIPASATRILPNAFLGCTNLTTATFVDPENWLRKGNYLDLSNPTENAKKMRADVWSWPSWVSWYDSEWTKKVS